MKVADSTNAIQLTEREHSVLQGMAGGLTDQGIADDLDLSVHTIKWYARRIYQKLDVSRRTEAIAVARSIGLIRDDLSPERSLPSSRTPLIGRTEEIEALFTLLGDEATSLVTVVGPGGIGKTRLALEVASQWQNRMTVPSYFIPLEDVTDPGDIPRAIATTMGLQFSGTLPATRQLLDRLSALSGLMVIDNFEQLLVAAPFVSRLLSASPDLAILVTSRERLGLQLETVFHLPGLAFAAENVSLAELSAVKLFCKTVRRLRPGIVVDGDELRTITAICATVEGMPLAIKLAAAWARVLPIERIATELESDLALLRSSMRDLPRRQQSMRLVFEGSWKLTGEKERLAFKRLSVFQGGFDLSGAEAVAGASLAIIGGLLDKSLLIRTEADRYRLHALLRQFGVEKLRNDPDNLYAETLDAHCRYYASLMRRYTQAVIEEMSAFMHVYLEMQADMDNILAAWQHALEWPLLDHIGDFAYSIAHAYGALGLNEQGSEVMQRAFIQLQRFPDLGNMCDRVVVLTAAGWFSANIGQYEKGLECLETAQAFAERIEEGNEAHVGLMKAYLAHVHLRAGNSDMAREVGEEALRFCRDVAYQWGEWVSLMVLGDLEAGEGEYEQALACHQQALNLAERSEYAVGMAYSWASVGMDYAACGEESKTIEALRSSLQLNREFYVSDPVFMTLVGMAMLAFHRGRYRDALELAAILDCDPRAGGSPRLRTDQLMSKVRREVATEVYDAVMAQAEAGLLSPPYVDADFALEPALIDRLLGLLKEQNVSRQN